MVRAKSQLLGVLLAQLEALSDAVESYHERVKHFFAAMPAAKLIKTLPGAKTGTIVAMLWAELGDSKNRWQSFHHLQAEAGGPGDQSERQEPGCALSFSCNKVMRHASYWLAFVSLNHSEWANHYYRDERAKGIIITKRLGRWEQSGLRSSL